MENKINRFLRPIQFQFDKVRLPNSLSGHHGQYSEYTKKLFKKNNHLLSKSFKSVFLCYFCNVLILKDNLHKINLEKNLFTREKKHVYYYYIYLYYVPFTGKKHFTCSLHPIVKCFSILREKFCSQLLRDHVISSIYLIDVTEYIFRVSLLASPLDVFMFVKSAMITRNSVLYALHTVWSTSWSVVPRSCWSIINRSASLRTVMGALIHSLRIGSLAL